MVVFVVYILDDLIAKSNILIPSGLRQKKVCGFRFVFEASG